jgi:hypothetical protein
MCKKKNNPNPTPPNPKSPILKAKPYQNKHPKTKKQINYPHLCFTILKISKSYTKTYKNYTQFLAKIDKHADG